MEGHRLYASGTGKAVGSCPSISNANLGLRDNPIENPFLNMKAIFRLIKNFLGAFF